MPVYHKENTPGFEQQPNDVYLALIPQILSGNENAFLKLYNIISPLLYGICIKYTSNRDDANDVFQIAMTNLYIKLETFNDSGLFIGWARKLFTNNCIDYLRHQKRQGFADLPDELGGEPPKAVSESILTEQELLKIIQKLSTNHRIHVVLFFIEGYKQAEIAKMLLSTEAAVKATINRAKTILAKYIIEEGGMHNCYT